MAVYTHLDDRALGALWKFYDEIPLLGAEGIPHGSINTTYRLTTKSGVYYLRINEKKSTHEVVYERDLLAVLSHADLGGVVTPSIRTNRSGSSFTEVERRWASIFPALPGADLPTADVTAAHVEQVGRFLARAHVALRAFRGGRANPFGMNTVLRWLDEIERVPTLVDVAARLRSVLAGLDRRLLPHGVVHGDLFVDNTKWDGGELKAVFDWEMAGRDHWALDVAVSLCAWCWRGDFDRDRCRALLAGYQSVRRFAPSEKRGFYVEALLAAARFTTSRLRDFEVHVTDAKRTYLDYRDFLARLDALIAMRERGFLHMVGLA